MNVTPEMIAAAWRAWRSVVGERAHLGPGPAFKEAIAAALVVAGRGNGSAGGEGAGDEARSPGDDLNGTEVEGK
jgi:hypothetical protein